MEYLAQLATYLRYLILRSTTTAGSGHVTSSLSAVELMTALFFDGFLRYDLTNPQHDNNDRVIFSKGHAAPLLYALYVVAGVIPQEELETLRQFSSRLEGHPTLQFPYTEAATGSLGQGLSLGVGLALNAKRLDKLSCKTFVLLGDSEMAEGQVWEAAQLATYYQLDNLIGIIDVNRLGQRGQTMYGHDVRSYAYKLRAFGWKTIVVNGHNFSELRQAYKRALVANKPVMIIARTFKGKGVSFLEDQSNRHGKALTPDEFEKAITELGGVPTSVKGSINQPDLEQPSPSVTVPVAEVHPVSPTNGLLATRKAFGNTLVELGRENSNVVVLDAELNNSTYTDLFAQAFPDRYFEMFIAEQNMVGVAQGLAHRGKVPVVSTYAAFFTRTFDQIRMAQYSQANIKFVGSHGGVSVGEDGASQMGLEDIAMFRAIHESVVLYPSDVTSTQQLTRLMVQQPGLMYLRTTRVDTPILYSPDEQFVIGGSKVVRHSDHDLATIVAAGITLHEALKAYDLLLSEGITIRVIDLYSIKPLDVATLIAAAKETTALITVEDHYAYGGIGEAVKSALVNESARVYSLSVNTLPHSGKPAELLAFEEVDATAIIKQVKNILK